LNILDKIKAESEELAESFINGNRNHVVQQLMEMPKGYGLDVAMRVYELLGEGDRRVLFKLVNGKLEA